MIEYVQIDGQRANLSIGRQRFPGYFSVDSMGLILGPNGSGKTRLMINAAEALTSGTQIGDQGHWSGWDSSGLRIGSDTKNPPNYVGVMYYTPLPYRRKIARHARFVDTSSLNGGASRSRSLRQFQFIAHRLGVQTELVGRLAYQRDIFRRLIVPRIVESDCVLIDPVLESRRLELMKLYSSPFDDVHRTEIDDFARNIEAWILGVIKQSDYTPLLLLGCLEHAAKSPSERAFATQAFLLVVGVAEFRRSDSAGKTPKIPFDENRFRKLLVATSNFLADSTALGLRTMDLKEQEGVEVQFDIARLPRRTNSTFGAFDIEWTNLSSGLLSLVEQFCRLELGLERFKRRGISHVLILIDEGDAFLHMDWQRQYILQLDHFLGGLRSKMEFACIQVLLATHSPIISGDFPSAMVQRLGALAKENAKTFGSSLDALVLETFGTPSIGEFAATKIKRLRQKFIAQTLDSDDQALIAEIGDIGLRNAITSRTGDAQ